MRLLEHQLYQNDIEVIATLPFDWRKLAHRTIMISGATGMIGSFFIDVIMYQNRICGLDCNIIALGRNIQNAQHRFSEYWSSENFCFVSCDLNKPLKNITPDEKIDYIFHAASNTHPVAYATDPIGTINTNVIGTYQLLEYAASHQTKRFIFASSVEIYGENRGDTDRFNESYCGYINCNSLRAGYPESKRTGEALCQSYISQKKLDIVIPRLSRTYGPTMLMSDTKAISQFIKKGIKKEDIVLKSQGTQFYSYTYVADAVSGILTCLFQGKCGEAYNISDSDSDITLGNLAQIIADYAETKVIFELPDKTEQLGYSTATKAILDNQKLRSLGWNAKFPITKGLIHTIDILRDTSSSCADS